MTLDRGQPQLLQSATRTEEELLDSWRSMKPEGYLIGGLWIAAGLWGLVQSV